MYEKIKEREKLGPKVTKKVPKDFEPIQIVSKMDRLFESNKRLRKIIFDQIKRNKEKVKTVVIQSSILTGLELSNLDIAKDINTIDELIEQYVGTYLSFDFYVSNAQDINKVALNYNFSSIELSEVQRLKIDLERAGETNQGHLALIQSYLSGADVSQRLAQDVQTELNKKDQWIKTDLLKILFEQEQSRQKDLFNLIVRISSGEVFEQPKKQTKEEDISFQLGDSDTGVE